MKKITFYVALTFLVSFVSCSLEEDDRVEELRINPNFRTTSSFVKDIENPGQRITEDGYCTSVNLIAGQNHIAGTVNVSREGDDLIITYSTNGDWTIDATHLSIGNCEDQTIPTTNSGNPKVGRFEHSTSHSTAVNEVTYVLDASVLEENYCFAAHAEVSGPTGGETAWAEGIEFDGNSWAMYVEALLSDCDEGDDGIL